jgi:hypothetical protein
MRLARLQKQAKLSTMKMAMSTPQRRVGISAGTTSEASAVMVNYAQSDPDQMESKQGSGPRAPPHPELERKAQAEFDLAIGKWNCGSNVTELIWPLT